ncbi:MAG TPA: hypothetical protein VFT29_06400 [Gemmatimonadaceae bacterium]|nr:hypothetical protein [Gemmatimonadaceae bacterium]
MTRTLVGFVAVALQAVALTTAAAQQQQQQPARLSQFLRQAIRLDASQMAAVDAGTPVVKTLETSNPRDVAVFGIIATNAPREQMVRRIKDFRTSLASPTRVRFGIFSTPAVPADVQSLVIDAKDAEDAKKCKPGDCSFKLAGTEMARIQREVDWNAKDMQAQLSAYAQRRLIEYVTAYRTRGDSAVASYDDHGNVSASAAFASLLSESPYVYQYAPMLAGYLRNYPHEKLDGITEAIFWSEDALPRLRRTLNVNHIVVHDPPGSRMTVVATKQIYAKHYFEAAFDLMSVIERENGAGSYVIVLRRYRFDNLPSGGLLNIKGRVLNSLKEKMTVDLSREKTQAERAAD